MKKTGILIGIIIIVISASAFYFLNTNPISPYNSSEPSPVYETDEPINEISDKNEIEQPENNNLTQSVKEYKPSPAPEVNPNIPDLQDKPEPVRTLLDPGKNDTKRNEAANFLRDAGYKGLTDDLIASLREEILNPKL